MQEKEFYKCFPIKMKSNKNSLLGQYNNHSQNDNNWKKYVCINKIKDYIIK